MRRLSVVLLLVLALAAGCKKVVNDQAPGAVEAGAGDFCQLGPVGLRVESVRLGKVRTHVMAANNGESEEIFVVRTRFQLMGEGPVKQQPLHSPGTIASEFAGQKLTDANGHRFKQLFRGDFTNVKGRRSTDAILTAEQPETTDVLIFESVAGADGDLTLEVPADYQTKTPEGQFLRPRDAGAFKFRIPKAMWVPPPITEVGPNNWSTAGPLSACVESVHLQEFATATAFVVTVNTKLTDPAVRVKKPPYQSSKVGFGNPSILLRDAAGTRFPPIAAFGFNRIASRQPGDVELTPQNPETRDAITFDSKAGEANELILTLYPNWQERKPDGTWAETTADGEFRFRIPRSMWAK